MSGGAGMFRLFTVVLIGAAAAAQTQIDLRTQARNVDLTAAASTKPLKTGTALPATCVVGDMFFKTDAPAGSNVYGCTAANTWAVQGNDTVMSGGSLVGNTGTVNFVTGTGLMTVIAATGPQINVQTAVDTAVVQTQPGEQGGAALLCASGSGAGRGARFVCVLPAGGRAARTGVRSPPRGPSTGKACFCLGSRTKPGGA